jgi:hypothetical protein
MRKRHDVMRRAVLALTLLAGGHAAAHDGEAGATRAVRISGGTWTALDAAKEAGFLTQYQYAQGVSVLPTSEGLWQETLPFGVLDGMDLLLVDAEDGSAAQVDEGRPLADILRHVVGPDLATLWPAKDSDGDDLKPQVPQLVLVLPAGTLTELFADGAGAEVRRILELEPQRLLGVRTESPCEEKCDAQVEATQVFARPLEAGAELPLPERVLANKPPDAAPQPVLNRGGPSLAIVSEGDKGTVLRAEAGSGADLYQWVLHRPDGRRWYLGETTTSAIEFTLAAEEAHSGLTLGAVAFTWDTSRQRYAAKEVPGTRPPPPPPPPPMNYVGVIPDARGCPKSSDLVTFHMDDEDKKNANTRGGWIGGITSTDNTTWRFCRVDASKFKPLSKDNIVQNHYAVLMLGGSCPAGSYKFSRYFDNEDKNNANWASANFVWSPNTSDRNTNLVFCVFRGGFSGTTMSAMPDVGFSYGVLAAHDFSRRIATGYVYTDDEDSSNKNSHGDPHGIYGDVSRIITMGANTTVRLVKVK